MVRAASLAWVSLLVVVGCTDSAQWIESNALPVNDDHPGLQHWPKWGDFPFEPADTFVPSMSHPEGFGLNKQDMATGEWRVLYAQPGDGDWGVDALDPPRRDVLHADAIMGPGDVAFTVFRTDAGTLWLYEWAPGSAAVGEQIPLPGTLPLREPDRPPPVGQGDLFLDALDDKVMVTFSWGTEDGRAETWVAIRDGGEWTAEPVFVPLADSPSTASMGWQTLGAFLPDGRPIVGAVHGNASGTSIGALYRAKLDGMWVDLTARSNGYNDIWRDPDGRVFISPSDATLDPDLSHIYDVVYGAGYRRRSVNWDRMVPDQDNRWPIRGVELNTGREVNVGGTTWGHSRCGSIGPNGVVSASCPFDPIPWWVGDSGMLFTAVSTHGSYVASTGPVLAEAPGGGRYQHVAEADMARIVSVDPPSGSTIPANLEWIRVETDRPAQVTLHCDAVERLGRQDAPVDADGEWYGGWAEADGILQYDPELCGDYYSVEGSDQCLHTEHDFVCAGRNCSPPGYEVTCWAYVSTLPHGSPSWGDYRSMQPEAVITYTVEYDEPDEVAPVAGLQWHDHECHQNRTAGEGWYGSFDIDAVALSVGVTDANVWLEDADGNEVPSTVTLGEVLSVLDQQLYQPPEGRLYRSFFIQWDEELQLDAEYTVRVDAVNALLQETVVEGPTLVFRADEASLVLVSTPVDGAADVPLDQAVLLEFNLAINPIYVNTNYMRLLDSAGTPVPTVLTQLDAQTVRILPTSELVAGETYTIDLNSSVQGGQCGRDLSVADRVRTFTTEAP